MEVINNPRVLAKVAGIVAKHNRSCSLAEITETMERFAADGIAYMNADPEHGTYSSSTMGFMVTVERQFNGLRVHYYIDGNILFRD